MKAFKIFAWVTGVLFALTVGAVVALTNLVDPNDYKPQISALVNDHTGRELDWHGDLELAFFPWLGVKTGTVALSNRAGFGSAPMLSVAQADIRVKLLPLLKKQLEVDTVRLNQPHIRLSRNADGVTNWGDLTAQVRRGGGQKLPSDAALLAGLAVQGVGIADGRVDWDDRAGGRTLTLRALNLDTGKLAPGESLDVALSFDAAGGMLRAPASVVLTTTAQLSADLKSVSLDDTDLRVAMQNLTADFAVKEILVALQTGVAELTGLRGDADHDGVRTTLEAPAMRFTVAGERLQLPRLDIAQGDFFLSASANGSGVMSGIDALTVSGNADARIKDLKGTLARNRVKFVPPPGLANAVDVGFEFDLADRNLALTDLTVASLEEPDGRLLINQKEIVIPLNADGSPEYGAALGKFLRAEAERKLSTWLLKQITPTDDADDIEADLKEKLNNILRNVLGSE